MRQNCSSLQKVPILLGTMIRRLTRRRNHMLGTTTLCDDSGRETIMSLVLTYAQILTSGVRMLHILTASSLAGRFFRKVLGEPVSKSKREGLGRPQKHQETL